MGKMIFNKKYTFVLAIICVLVLAFKNANPDYPNKESLLMDVVLQSLEYNHYTEAKVDNVLSERAFDIYLKRVDLGKRYFLQNDIDVFTEHKEYLDDYAKNKDFKFFDKLNKIRDIRVAQTQIYYQDILSKPMDFNISKTNFETNTKKIRYAQSEEEIKQRWSDMLKYRVMLDLYTKIKRQDKAKEENDTSYNYKSFEVLEQSSRDNILKQFDRLYKDMQMEDRDDKIAAYVNTIANVMEPHTGYFPPLEKENFNIRISGKLEGIGAQLTQEDGYTKVVRIVPGSASFRQGDLEVNDLIIKVGQVEEDPVDIVDMKLDDVLPLIRGEKGSEVRLTVKKSDGSIEIIPIIRDIVVLEESYAKSAVIEHKKQKSKIGLIDLGSFYADFQDPRGRRCSRDVKREVQKLIAEGIDGIIIDLRFNGGGSLRDVVDMSGLFIPTGPIVQVKSRDGRPRSLEDRDPSVLYEGPLVILVNSFSASASEIMAAALQDYGRAIIVGTSPSTFGKGTVQRFYDLDAVVPERYKDLGALGSMKITIQKFFRINGGSTQLKGVIPDIVLPGVYSYTDIGEKKEDFPMPWTEIEPVYFKKNNIKKLDKIIKRSEKRVSDNAIFSMIDERGKWLLSLQEDTEVSLNLEEYKLQQDNFNKASEKYKDISKKSPFLSIMSPAADKATLESDTTRAKSIKNWHKNLQKDPYLNEAIHIVNDWK
jgi:carboxyl-terminal processing protease